MGKVKRHILWMIFGLIIGIFVGILECIFGKVLLFVTNIRVQYFMVFIFFLPIIGLFIKWLYQFYGKESSKGMTLLFEVGQNNRDVIPVRLIPIITLSTWLTHLVGGSAGREGVAIQIGGTFTNWFSRHVWKKFIPSHEKKQQMIIVTGMAAGFAGLFHTPIAATFFSMELLAVGYLSIESLLSASVAAVTSSYISQFLGLTAFSTTIRTYPELTIRLILVLCLLGCIFGLVGRLFSISLEKTKLFIQSIQWPIYKKMFFFSVILMVGLIIAGKGRYSGLGNNLVEAAFYQGTVYSYDFLLKLIFTVFTLSIGFQGGEVTPLFSIGATCGVLLAHLCGLPVEFVASLGFASVFASATNTLVAPLFIAGEIFGFELLPYAFFVIIASYLMNNNDSIYPNQKV
ncbi:chloride channel protein [Vagococcus luciliae]|uniref:Chloride/fluoride channel protein n=1 Tax=Vagococcus luciliae TaxID=2920380 RepID=A0ABY5NX85_9ENTE|nr:chloride channel protein [Vagococcus luciliae]UUV98098.1 Chloride/fluoride channel protein [Vagococcus luciliae]